MPVGFDFYDQEHDAPAQRGNVVDLWAVDEDWDFPTYGALALQPDPVEPARGGAFRPERASFPFESTGFLRYRAADGHDGSPRLRRAGEAAPA